MGIVPSTFKQATCTRLLLWFALLLLSLLRLMPMPLFSMEPMATLALLVPTHMPMELTHMLMVDMESPMPPTPYELPELPQLPSPLLLVDMLVLADMLPTLPELSMLPRDPLMLSQRLMLMLLSSTELTDMVDMVLDMPDTDMELTHMPLDTPMVVTHVPMVPTTERDLLMPSQKLMLPTCMELMDMVDTVLDTDLTDMDTHMLMVDMDTHMPMESKL